MESELTVIALFAVATIVALLARRLKVPYTVALVIAGAVLGGSHTIAPPHLTKELLFAVFLPGLIFEAAFAIDAGELWRNRLAVSSLAFPGVVVATVATAAVLVAASGALSEHFSWTAAFLFAALVAATDPIAVIAVFKAVGAPHRLRLLVEGESLLNDGTGIVIFGIVLAASVSGGFSFGSAIVDFLRIVGIGVAVGTGVGLVISELIRRIDDPMLETTLTTVAAWGSFLVAEHFGGSGVIATVGAGLLCGNYAARTGMGPATRLAVNNFWEYLAFALNSLVFLLIGFEVSFTALIDAWLPIVLAFLAMTVGRALVVTAVTFALQRSSEKVPPKWAAVLTWGGMRGGLSMVLALALPPEAPARDTIITLTFGVVVLSILVQGSTMALLLGRLGLTKKKATEAAEVEKLRAGGRAAQAAIDAIDRAASSREIFLAAANEAKRPYLDRLGDIEKRLHEIGDAQLLEHDKRQAGRRALTAERAALLDAARAGSLDDEAARELAADVDARLLALRD